MTFSEIIFPLLIAVSAVVYGIFSGRAQASRLRSLHRDILKGNRRGYLIILIVIFMVVASVVLQP